jgi:hypothetical protein
MDRESLVAIPLALAALSTFAAAMKSRTFMIFARCWPSGALDTGFPACCLPYKASGPEAPGQE